MKKLLIILATLLVLQLKASAEEPITLRYNFPAGTEITYKVQTASVSRFRGLAGVEHELSGRTAQTTCYRLLSTATDGTMEWEQEILSGTVKINDASDAQEEELPKTKFRFKLTPWGKITLLPSPDASSTEEASPAKGAGAAARLASNSELDQLLPAIFLPLPKTPVKPGDIWEASLPTNFSLLPTTSSEGAGAELKVKSKLVELTRRQGKPCAKINTTLFLPFSRALGKSGNFSLNLTGKMTAELEWYFDYARARTLTAAGAMQMGTKITPEGTGEERAASLQSTVSIKSNITTTLLE
jgi:hypothetical protein